ncbi:hypothetical protein FRC11_005058 [Ceratobasidium sp. 423]|nr:hypothetical protein FRC11_005058 [Ceratobasidium sp. 423]
MRSRPLEPGTNIPLCLTTAPPVPSTGPGPAKAERQVITLEVLTNMLHEARALSAHYERLTTSVSERPCVAPTPRVCLPPSSRREFPPFESNAPSPTPSTATCPARNETNMSPIATTPTSANKTVCVGAFDRLSVRDCQPWIRVRLPLASHRSLDSREQTSPQAYASCAGNSSLDLDGDPGHENRETSGSLQIPTASARPSGGLIFDRVPTAERDSPCSEPTALLDSPLCSTRRGSRAPGPRLGPLYSAWTDFQRLNGHLRVRNSPLPLDPSFCATRHNSCADDLCLGPFCPPWTKVQHLNLIPYIRNSLSTLKSTRCRTRCKKCIPGPVFLSPLWTASRLNSESGRRHFLTTRGVLAARLSSNSDGSRTRHRYTRRT